MASPDPGPGPATVTDLRPPVRQATLVRSDVAHTFAVFVDTIAVWWPVQPYSRGGERVRDVTIEPHVGGRVYETWADGTEVDWGQLLVWEPPHRLVMTWNNSPAPTEVELTFTALGPVLTRVAVEHRGWEALSDAQLARMSVNDAPCGGYTQGWTRVLACLAAATDGRSRRRRA